MEEAKEKSHFESYLTSKKEQTAYPNTICSLCLYII